MTGLSMTARSPRVTTWHAHGDAVYVKPASRESRLVMVRLEPKAKKKRPKRENKQNKPKGQQQEHEQDAQRTMQHSDESF